MMTCEGIRPAISAPKTRARRERGDREAAGDGRQPPVDIGRTVHTGADLGGELEDESGSSNVRPGNG
jgi:hypothetical protein